MVSYVAEVGRSAAALGVAAATYNVPFTAAVPVGNTLVMAVNTTIGGTGGQTGLTATDTKGNVWTQRVIQDVYSTGNRSANGNIAVLTCTVTTPLTTSDSVTITSGGGSLTRWAVLIEEFASIAGVDVSSGGQATTTSITSGVTAAAAQAAQTVIGVAGWPDAGGTTSITPTAPAGFTASAELSTYSLNATSPRAIEMWWADVNAAGTRTATATLNTAEPNAGVVLALNQTVAPPSTSAGNAGDTLTTSMNRLAKTSGLAAQGAANVWAGTQNLELVHALNVKAGNTLPNFLELAGVLNQLAGTTGLGVDAAAAAIQG